MPFGDLGAGPGAVTLALDPPSASVEIVNGAIVPQAFKALDRGEDGTTRPVKGVVSWTSDSPALGEVDSGGTFHPNGFHGGLVTVTATLGAKTATAKLAVKVHDIRADNIAGPGTFDAVKAATLPDGKVIWRYPFDRTVFPRGLGAVPLQWQNGTPGDHYYIQLKSPFAELEVFTAAPQVSDAEWAKFENSTIGDGELTVNRWDGQAATRVVHQTWTFASAPLRGSIYYWARDPGRMLRIKPGTAPEDFTKGLVPDADTGCNMKCHSVSANGSMLVGGGSALGGTLDLKANTIRYAVGRDQSATTGDWEFSALTPDGQYVLRNPFSSLHGPKAHDLLRSSDGSRVANAGVSAELPFSPAFSPDGRSLVFISGGNEENPTSSTIAGTLRAYDFDPDKTPMFSNVRSVVAPGNDPKRNIINWPSVSPDGRWVIYSRQPYLNDAVPPGYEPSIVWQLNARRVPQGSSELYIADLQHPGSDRPLTALGGRNDAVAAADRTESYDYQPSFAPVASGGYYWVVFHSRRAYGSELRGSAEEVKQLWIAAIDQNPAPGKDPSHPAFRLPAQSKDTFNQRGYFALGVCQDDGRVCADGTECCSGSCVVGASSTFGTCGARGGCGLAGDRCDASADCCGAKGGVTCINHVCAEPTR
jgi:hypothetical protein